MGRFLFLKWLLVIALGIGGWITNGIDPKLNYTAFIVNHYFTQIALTTITAITTANPIETTAGQKATTA